MYIDYQYCPVIFMPTLFPKLHFLCKWIVWSVHFFTPNITLLFTTSLGDLAVINLDQSWTRPNYTNHFIWKWIALATTTTISLFASKESCKMKYHTVETNPNPNRKIVETEIKLIPPTHIYMTLTHIYMTSHIHGLAQALQ